jgi:hypothetical protein
MEEINSNILKVRGEAELSEPLELSKEYKIELTADVKSITTKDKDDGTFDKIFSATLLSATILTENGKIEVKDKRRRSQKMRNSWHFIWQEEGCPGNFEEFYNNSMAITNANLPEIYAQYVKKK